MWATHPDADIREEWGLAMEELSAKPYRLIEVPMEERCLTVVENPALGKNMFALGMLMRLYGLDREHVCEEIADTFRGKSVHLRYSGLVTAY